MEVVENNIGLDNNNMVRFNVKCNTCGQSYTCTTLRRWEPEKKCPNCGEKEDLIWTITKTL